MDFVGLKQQPLRRGPQPRTASVTADQSLQGDANALIDQFNMSCVHNVSCLQDYLADWPDGSPLLS